MQKRIIFDEEMNARWNVNKQICLSPFTENVNETYYVDVLRIGGGGMY